MSHCFSRYTHTLFVPLLCGSGVNPLKGTSSFILIQIHEFGSVSSYYNSLVSFLKPHSTSAEVQICNVKAIYTDQP